MTRKTRNHPTLGEVVYPNLTKEENEANIKKIQDVLILIGIHHLQNKDK